MAEQNTITERGAGNQTPEPSRLDVLDFMESHGGGFVSRLAVAWLRADLDNDRRLMEGFGHYYAEYRDRLVAFRARKAVGRGVAR
jgi:hypothetical protein